MSLFRRAGASIARFFTSTDPAAVAGELQLYSKVDGSGISQLFGRSNDGTIHQITPNGALQSLGTLVFGNGMEGSPVFDGVSVVAGISPITPTTPSRGMFNPYYMLNRNFAFQNCTINAGVDLSTAGWIISVRGTLTLNGNIGRWGMDGLNAVGIVSGVTAAPPWTSGTGLLGNGTNGNVTSSPPGFGIGGLGYGGVGGVNDVGSAAGNVPGGVSSAALTQGDLSGFYQAMSGRQAGNTVYNGGGAGGLGVPGSGGAPGGGGGRASGGGCTVIMARRIVYGGGQILAYGGNGGVGVAGGGGGGGGGGGWAVVMIGEGSQALLNVNVDVAGGLGGAPGGSGASATGAAGNAGRKYLFGGTEP